MLKILKVSWNSGWFLAALAVIAAFVATMHGHAESWEPQTCGTCGAVLYEDGYCPRCRK